MVGRFQADRDEALEKAREAEERVKKAVNEQEKATSKLLNLRRNAAKLLRYIQEVSYTSTVPRVMFTGCVIYTPLLCY